jgi:hypothetical protein
LSGFLSLTLLSTVLASAFAYPSESRPENPTDILFSAVVFFKTIAPVEPVSFIHKICEDAMAEPMRKRTRTAKRLAPMTLMGKATMEGLESVARDVLAPHFHQAPVTPKKVSLIDGGFASSACSALHWSVAVSSFLSRSAGM